MDSRLHRRNLDGDRPTWPDDAAGIDLGSARRRLRVDHRGEHSSGLGFLPHGRVPIDDQPVFQRNAQAVKRNAQVGEVAYKRLSFSSMQPADALTHECFFYFHRVDLFAK